MNSKPDLKNPTFTSQEAKYSVNAGLSIGGVLVAFYLLLYLINPAFLAKIWLSFVIFAANAGLVFMAAFRLRKLKGGYISFGELFISTYVVIVITGLVTTAFNVLLFNVFDPGLEPQLIEASIDSMVNFAGTFNVPDAQLDPLVQQIREGTDFSAVALLQGYFFNAVLMGALGALIVALIVKKKQPGYEV